REPVRPLLLHLVEAKNAEVVSIREKELKGSRCSVIHVKSEEKEYLFTLDPKYHYAPVQVEYREKGVPRWICSNQDYKQLTPVFWFPYRSSLGWYNIGAATVD